VIAAAASATAAIVVSHIWKDGTVIAAAMTPVIVSIVKELLAKPMESELVKKPVAKIASGSRAVVGVAVPTRSGCAEPEQRGHGDPLMDGDPHEPPTQPRGPQADPGMTPIRTYGTPSRRRRTVHLKVALITGLVAFVIAAAALTLPELIFGGAISSHHSTTFFGGGSSKKSKDKAKDENDTNAQPGQQQSTTTTPQQTTPQQTTPQQTTPQQTTPQQTTPQQAPPAQTTPVPTTPTPPTP
jgi:hypothetical protein